MELYNWKNNLKTNIFLLRLAGVWPDGEAAFTLGPYLVYSTLLFLFFMIGHIYFQAMELYLQRNNLQVITAIVYVLLIEFVVILKSYFLLRNMKKLKELFEILNSDLFQPKNNLQIEVIDGNIWFWKLVSRIFMFFASLLMLLWAIYPLLDKTEGNERALPFLAWYPYDATKSPLYEITYIYQVLSVIYETTIAVNIDGLVAAMNTFNASQFDILRYNLRNIRNLGPDIARNFVKCVKHHKEILSYSAASNQFLNWILLVQFFASAISLGMTMFQLTLVEPMTSQFYSLVNYLITMTLQIFMYCWFGNEVEVKSNNIPYAVFECDWTDFSQELKKELLFFTTRVQMPVKLSTLNLFYLSVNTFMSILKTSWSYFALLRQVSGKN